MGMKLVRINGELTPEQQIAVEYLSQPKNGGLSLGEVAKKCGVSERQLYRWRIDPVFAEIVKKRTMNNVAMHLPAVMDSLTERALNGTSVKAIEVWLRANGLLHNEVHVSPVQPKDDRSTETLLAELEVLEAEYNRLNGGTTNE